MLSNEYFLAKFSFDTAENKPAKNLHKILKIGKFYQILKIENRKIGQRCGCLERGGCGSAMDRFTAELEFVQGLANPSYLGFLAREGYFADPKFVEYIRYSTAPGDCKYWRTAS